MKRKTVLLAAVASLGVVAAASVAMAGDVASPVTPATAKTPAPDAADAPRTTNPDPKAGWYKRIFIPTCPGRGWQAGPIPTPAPGTPEAQPGYQFLIDYTLVPSECRP